MDGFDLPGGDWLAMARLLGALIGGYLLVVWFASVLWVYRDIRARTNDPVSQVIGIAIAVVFPIIGLPIYLVLRPSETLQEAYDRQLEQEAILSELHSISACPDCRRPVSDEFMVCAYCGTQLRQPCASCSHLLQFAWRHCPFCAAPQPRRSRAAAAGGDGATREAPPREPRESREERQEQPTRASRASVSEEEPQPTAATRRRTAAAAPADVEADEEPRRRTRTARADESPAS
jgi:hypothetical protein